MLRAVLGLGVALLGLLSSQAQAASFGYAENSKRDSWVITTGAGLVVTVHKASCDIKSLLYNGQELQSRLKGSHVNSGLGSVSSSIQSFTDGKASAQISCSQTGLVHYYLFRANENNIYMGTYNTAESNMPNLRWITRLDRKTIASGPVAADISGGVTAVEGSDVFRNTKTGDTRSKFYSAIPFYQDNSHKAWGSAGAVHMIIGQGGYESSLGGPFFRDHDNQVTDDTSELYFVPYSSHSQTESIRYGFHGPYALAFTSGGDPSGVDFTFFQRRNLMGFVPDSSRGQVNGKIRDGNQVLNGAASVVHFYNEQAQYWTMSNNNNFVSPMMKPGTYDVSVYRKELEVGTTKVTVSRGSTTTIPIDVTFVETKPIWRIGEWDGTPDGFLNADKIHYMHPSDHRMAAWTKSFVVGSTSASQFPMALFRAVNAPLTIQCSLTAAQASSTLTLRVGVTLAQSAARPIINVNNKWSSPIPASYAIKSRGITRGVTSGNYFVYEYAVPASAWQSGTNSIVMSIASGVTDPDGTPFLSASVVFDAVELVGSASTPTTAPTTAPTPAPTPTPTPSQSHDTPAPTTPAPTSSGSVAKYGQCGGSNYSGPTTCKDSTCTKVNDYYSQCL